MTTQAQIDANRRNAQNSTGPRTPEGKAAVRLNSLWHGAFATDLLLPGEDAEAFSQLRDEFYDLYQPASQAEDFLVSRMLLAVWRLQRLAAMESRVLRAHAFQRSSDAGMLTSIKAAVLGPKIQPETADQDSEASHSMALAWIRDANGGDALAKLARYQTSLERSFYRAFDQLQLLRPRPDKAQTEPAG